MRNLDPAERIQKLNEVLSGILEQMSFSERRTKRMEDRIRENELRDQLRQQNLARKEAEQASFDKKVMDRYSGDAGEAEIKRLGLSQEQIDALPAGTDEAGALARAKALRKLSLQNTYARAADTARNFHTTDLGRDAANEILRQQGKGPLPDPNKHALPGAEYDVKQVLDARAAESRVGMAAARARDAMTPGQRQAERDRQAQARIANWEAGQRQGMMDRIAARSETGKAYVAAAGQARAAEENLRNVNANQKSLAQIRAENLKSREDLERQIRGENPRAYSESDPTQDQQAQIITNRLTRGLNYFKPKQVNPDSQSSASDRPTSTQAQTGYEFYNRDSGQIERSNAPGVDRVFRDSSGKAYRIEGGSGKKIYI